MEIAMEKDSMTAYRSRGQRCGRHDTEEAVKSSFVHRPKLYSTDSSLSDLMGRSIMHLSYNSSQDDGSSFKSVNYHEDSRIDLESPEQIVPGKSRPSNTPVIFGVGVVSGSVDDAGLGFLSNTKDYSVMRAATSMDVKLKDSRILAQIREPIPQDPFRFLGIKWNSYLSTKAISIVSKQRDVVGLEFTEIEEVPEFHKNGLVRLRMSSCRIMWPYNCQGELEVLFSRTLLDTVQVVEESNFKKLAWFVHMYPQRRNSCENDEK